VTDLKKWDGSGEEGRGEGLSSNTTKYVIIMIIMVNTNQQF